MHVLRRLHHVYIWNKDIFINCKKKNRKERDRIIRLYLYKLYAVGDYEMNSILDMYISHAILLALPVNDAKQPSVLIQIPSKQGPRTGCCGV